MSCLKNKHIFPRQRKNAVVALMAPPGTPLGPALDALFAACRVPYGGRISYAASPTLLSLDPAHLVRVKSAAALQAAPRIVTCDMSVEALRRDGVAMLDCLSALQADLFVLGDAAAMRLIGRIALWSRERQAACRWIGIPACPCNSVPFTASSIGFGSAVRWCAALATALLDARRRDPRGAPIGILEIAGDNNGWLSAGAAALAGSHQHPVFCITPDMAVDAAALCAALCRAIKTHGCAVLATSAVLHDAARRPIAPSGMSSVIALRHLIATHVKLDAVVATVHPTDMLDPAHVSRRDMTDSRTMARAAARVARKAEACVVLNRRAAGMAYRLLTHTMPLLEAADSPRTLPPQYIRPSAFLPQPALRDHLLCFAPDPKIPI